MPSASKKAGAAGVLGRVLEAAEFLDWSGRELARQSGVSASQIGVAKLRGGDLQWSTVEALVSTLHAQGFSRDWLLFDEEPKLIQAISDEPPPPPVQGRKKRR